MTRRELIDFCLTFPSAYEDYPFGNITDDDIWTVMRHQVNTKSFAFIYTRGGSLCVNLKCDPVEAGFFRQVYQDVTPAFHMNKEHWNTIVVGGDVPDQELLEMIRRSYDLIKPQARKKSNVITDINEIWPYNLYAQVFGGNYGEIPKDAADAIEYVLNKLKKKEKAIVLARLKEYKTFSAIGRDFSISGSRTAQLYRRAIRKMKLPAHSRFLIDLTGQIEHDLAAEEAAKEVSLQVMEKRKVELAKGTIDEITLDDLELTVRSYNCLCRAGIKTLTDISGLTLRELYGIRNLGRKCSLEILATCEKYGVSLAGESGKLENPVHGNGLN